MRGDRQNGDLASVGAVTPEQPVRRRRTLLNVGLEDALLRTVRVFQRMERVGLEGRMPRIGLEKPEGLLDLLDQTRMPGDAF